MSKCRVCKRSTTPNPEPLTVATGVCGECRRTLGIIAMPPARRPAIPCVRCSGQRFIRAIPRELDTTVAPMTLTHAPRTAERAWFPGRTVDIPSVSTGVGTVEAYVCTGCGFIEWYCLDPEAIPIGPEYMTEVIDHSTGQPYR